MDRSWLQSVVLASLLPLSCSAAQPNHFNPDTDPSRIGWTRIGAVLGPAPDVRDERFGIVIKTLTNEYWRLMAAGYRKRAAADGVKLDVQAAQDETDHTRQLAIMENMIGNGYKGLLISPMSSSNLQSAIDDATMVKLPVVDVDGAVVDSVEHFVGARNRDMGILVANHFIRHYPKGGPVAVIKGQEGVFSTVQRTAGFLDTLAAAKVFDVVPTGFANWDRQQAYDTTIEIVHKRPDIIGIYCNNDTMALGAVEAVKSLHMLGQIQVIGTDGTRDAYQSIKAGELKGTVDIFPMLTGEIGLEIAERLSVGQRIPRVIETPMALVTLDTMARYEGDGPSLRKALMEDAALMPVTR